MALVESDGYFIATLLSSECKDMKRILCDNDLRHKAKMNVDVSVVALSWNQMKHCCSIG